ncbi:uncharacterized protein B0I36DRAFT_357217 [Microdochium trichocladiopsis]|uniref:Uncharacterized protein n=1 Tax=Microdochium trichocladiopsis TaxID=1682393 RepID=A0A9P8YG06_9PEZI|nr:uncharacterized protein B0I36DRAFT_357217 [Microdochium trichocladiopsis]KAH7039831.1 hypothetical protein B0I36DRAFT_357217 [Microdochium trichocladiopsis]
MHKSLLWKLACSTLLFAAASAQDVSSTTDAAPTDAPTETPTGSSSAPPSVTASASSSAEEPSGTVSQSTSATSGGGGSSPTGGGGTDYWAGKPADVKLRVPELHVGRIELVVDNLQADINLAAQVANLVELNAGVQVGIQKVNVTIAEVDAELDLVIRLGNLVDIVNRTLESLNLNPLLINVLEDVGDLAGAVIGAVDGLLGSIVNGDSTINFLIDNLGNIVQEVAGGATGAVSSIVGNYLNNMTFTGAQEILKGGNIQKTYSYSPLNSLVNIIFNSVGHVVQAVVVKGGSGGGGGGGSTSTTTASTIPTASATPTAARRS